MVALPGIGTMTENPFQSPDHDKKDSFRHWTMEYKLKRLRVYRVFITLAALGMILLAVFIVNRYLDHGELALAQLAILVSTSVMISCAGLLVRHYRLEIERYLRKKEADKKTQ